MLQEKIQIYQGSLSKFCEGMLLNKFCEVQNTKKIRLFTQFEEVVVKFVQPGFRDARLHPVLRQFRRDYCRHHKLHEFAMIFAHADPHYVTWFVPKSVVDKLFESNNQHLLESYSVKEVKVAGESVYSFTHQVSVYLCLQ